MPREEVDITLKARADVRELNQAVDAYQRVGDAHDEVAEKMRTGVGGAGPKEAAERTPLQQRLDELRKTLEGERDIKQLKADIAEREKVIVALMRDENQLMKDREKGGAAGRIAADRQLPAIRKRIETEQAFLDVQRERLEEIDENATPFGGSRWFARQTALSFATGGARGVISGALGIALNQLVTASLPTLMAGAAAAFVGYKELNFLTQGLSLWNDLAKFRLERMMVAPNEYIAKAHNWQTEHARLKELTGILGMPETEIAKFFAAAPRMMPTWFRYGNDVLKEKDLESNFLEAARYFGLDPTQALQLAAPIQRRSLGRYSAQTFLETAIALSGKTPFGYAIAPESMQAMSTVANDIYARKGELTPGILQNIVGELGILQAHGVYGQEAQMAMSQIDKAASNANNPMLFMAAQMLAGGGANYHQIMNIIRSGSPELLTMVARLSRGMGYDRGMTTEVLIASGLSERTAGLFARSDFRNLRGGIPTEGIDLERRRQEIQATTEFGKASAEYVMEAEKEATAAGLNLAELFRRAADGLNNFTDAISKGQLSPGLLNWGLAKPPRRQR
jgi:hypothetical protein